MNNNLLIEQSDKFGLVFNDWRIKRVRKLEQIFGVDWFQGKKILELGCGYGNVGLYLQNLGAEMTFCDARTDFLDVIKGKCQKAKIICLNQEKKWDLNDRFDLIIHWGVLYHLNNWKQDLECALKQTKYLCLESAVNKFENSVEFKVRGYVGDKKIYTAFDGVGTLPSSSLIEGQFNQYANIRFDDEDLNGQGNFMYTQPSNEIFTGDEFEINNWDDIRVYGQRKFWLVNTDKLK